MLDTAGPLWDRLLEDARHADRLLALWVAEPSGERLDRLSRWQVPVLPLWHIQPESSLRTLSPHLTELWPEGPELPRARQLAIELFHGEAGLFLHARASLPEVRRSLHAFALAEIPGDRGRRWFRFERPAVFQGMVETYSRSWLGRFFETLYSVSCRSREGDDMLVTYQLTAKGLARRLTYLPTGYSGQDFLEPPAEEPSPAPAASPSSSQADVDSTAPFRLRREQLTALENQQQAQAVGRFPGETFPVRLSEAQALRLRKIETGEIAAVIEDRLQRNYPELVRLHSFVDRRDMIRTAIRRARSWGFFRSDAIADFAELMFRIAPNFDEHPKAREVLSGGEPPEERLRRLFEAMTWEDWEEAQALHRAEAWELVD